MLKRTGTIIRQYSMTLHKQKKPQKSFLHSDYFNPASPATVVIPSGSTPEPFVKQDWTPVEKRTGVLAVKKGMLSLWDSWGQQLPVTVLQMEDAYVVGHRTKALNGYDALIVGCRRKNIESKLDIEMCFYQIEACVRAKLGMCLERLAEFKITPKGFIPVGTQLNASHFVAGQFVDVQSVSKDKGFQGVMKRWGFKGQPQTHGTSLSHRSPGSIGQRKDPGKVFKGKKMAGHMGGENVTIPCLQVVKIDRELNLIYVRGSIAGPNGSIVKIRDSVFKSQQFDPYTAPPPFPTRTAEELSQIPSELDYGQLGKDPLA